MTNRTSLSDSAPHPANIFSLLLCPLLCIAPNVSRAQQQIIIDTDFNDDPALNLFGAALLTNAKGGVDGPTDNYISVTDNLGDQRGAIVFDDPTGGLPIPGFTIRADLRVGGGTSSPADGFSFNLVRPGDPLIGSGEGYAASPTGEANLPEEGSTTGLAIGFDEWFSGGSDTIGMSIRLDNKILEEIPLPTQNGELDDITSLQTGPLGPLGEGDDSLLGWAPIEISLDDGILTIAWKEDEVFRGKVNWFPSPGQIILGGRTGGSNANHHMDNLFVSVTAADEAVVSGTRSGADFFEIDITDVGASVLDSSTLSLIIDDVDVTASAGVSKAGDVTTVRHNQSPAWDLGTQHGFEFQAQDTSGGDIVAEGDFLVPVPTDIFPGVPLLGYEDGATAGFWGVRSISNTGGQIGVLDTAIELVYSAALDPGFAGQIEDSQQEAMNHGGGDPNRALPDLGFPLGAGGDDFLMYGVGYVRFPAGTHTVAVNSDDGFFLRLLDVPFDAVGGNGEIHPDNPDTIRFVAPTGASNTVGVFTLPSAQTVRCEFLWYERGGGEHGEVAYAAGDFLVGDPADGWLALGITRQGGQEGLPGFDSGGATVTSVGPGAGTLDSIAALEAALATGPTFESNHDQIDFIDPGFGAVGDFAVDEAFPIDTAADDDDHGLFFEANLVIPVGGEYILGFQGDDGSYIRVIDQEFTAIVEGGPGGNSALIDEDGARLICDCLTGDSSSSARITLAAGTYQMEGTLFERGGGSWIEVFGAGATSGVTVLLEKDGAGTVEFGGGGVPLVNPGGGIRITEILYNKASDEFTLTWSSRGNATYALFFSNDLQDFGADLEDSIESGGELTTFGPFANPEPGASEIFFRVSENE